MFQVFPRIRTTRIFLVTVFCSCLGLSLPTYAENSSTAHLKQTAELYETALDRFSAGAFNETVIHLKNALELSSKHLSARVLLGMAFLELGKFALAEQELLLAKGLGADKNLVDPPLGRTYLAQRKYELLLNNMNPENYQRSVAAKIALLHAQAHMERKEFSKAEWRYETAEAMGADPVDVTLGKVQAQLNLGETERADKLLKMALLHSPMNVKVLYLSALISQTKGDRETALSTLTKVVELNPEHLQARLNRAALYIEDGKTDQAWGDIRFVLEKWPGDPMAVYLQSMVLSLQGKESESLKTLKSVAVFLDKMPTDFVLANSQILILAGAVAFEQGRYEEASGLLEQYLAQYPQNAGARKRLAAIHLIQNHPLKALEVLQTLLPDRLDHQALSLAGTAYYKAGNIEQAIEFHQQALNLDPANTGIKLQLARAQASINRSNEAIALLETIDKGEMPNHEADYYLAELYLQTGHSSKAVEQADYLTRLNPDNPDAWNLLGAALGTRADAQGARKALGRALALKPGYRSAILNLAKLDILQGNTNKARDRYLQLLTEDATNADTLSALVGLELLVKNPQEAIRIQERIVSAYPESIEEGIRLVDLYLQNGKPKKGLDYAQEMSSRFKENFNVELALVRSEIAAGQSDNARVTLRAMATNASYDASKLIKISELQIRIGAHKQAYWSLIKTSEASPNSLFIQKRLLSLELKLGKLEKALVRARSIQSSFPLDAHGQFLAGETYMANGNHTAALLAYNRSQDLQPKSITVSRVFTLLRKSGEKKKADQIIKQWLGENPDDMNAWETLASAQIAEERYIEAQNTYENIVSKSTRPSSRALNHLAMLYQMNSDARALGLAKKAHAQDSDNPYVLDTLGWAYVENGDTILGLQYLRDALSRNSNEPTTRYHMAVTLYRLGRREEAISYLKGVLRGAGEFPFKAQALALYDTIMSEQ